MTDKVGLFFVPIFTGNVVRWGPSSIFEIAVDPEKEHLALFPRDPDFFVPCYNFSCLSYTGDPDSGNLSKLTVQTAMGERKLFGEEEALFLVLLQSMDSFFLISLKMLQYNI